jgi:hypothetical protein
MARRLIIILGLVCFLSPDSFPQIKSDNDLLRETVRLNGQVRVSIPLQGKNEMRNLSRMVSVSTVRNKSVEIVLSPRTVEWFILQKLNYSVIDNPDPKSIKTASDVNEAMQWETYPTYTQYDSIMRSFQSKYPSLCNLDTIGTSINGKLVLVIKISDNVKTDEDEPETFYTSTMHGDETGGFILTMRLADYLLKNYNANSRVKNLVDNLEIWINPLANPDGTYRTGNSISSPIRNNAGGYDLNRNFPDPEKTGTVPQKENLDMIKFLRKHNFVISANFHSGEEVVNYPWDRWFRLHADNDWFHYISRKYADTAHLNSVPGYMTFLDNGVTNGYDWYPVLGGRQDFVTWELHGREVTIELDDNYVTPAAQLNTLWQYNRQSLIGYLENAMYGIHGSVRDAVTGNPVPARIFIQGHDMDSSHVYSDILTGSFTRLIYPGKWDITFSASGYISKIIPDVEVTQGRKTELTVGMVPAGIAEGDQMKFVPNPAREIMNVILPERQIGRVNVRIYNMLGWKLEDYYENTFKDIPLIIDLRRFAGGTYIIVIANTVTKVTDRGRFVVVQ